MIFDTLRTELGRQSDEDKGRLHQYHAVGANIAEVSASADFLAVTCELLSCTHYRPAFYPIFLATHSSLAKNSIVLSVLRFQINDPHIHIVRRHLQPD